MAKNPEFKSPPDVRVKQPESAGLFGEDPATDESPAIVEPPSTSVEWLDLPSNNRTWTASPGEYPFNGQPVWLTPDDVTEYLATWRTTRKYNGGTGRFEPTAFWAVHNGGGVKIDFEPVGYRRYEPPIYIPEKKKV